MARRWYVIHTYSGYENKVKTNIEHLIETQGLENNIFEILIPTEEVTELKEGGRRVTTERKVFPGYVLVKMIMTDETWYVVRNARGVTGFVGPSSKPIPLSEEEVEKLGVETQVRSAPLAYKVGDNVQITGGPLEGFSGRVESIDLPNNVVKVIVSMFGRETAVELALSQVRAAE